MSGSLPVTKLCPDLHLPQLLPSPAEVAVKATVVVEAEVMVEVYIGHIEPPNATV